MAGIVIPLGLDVKDFEKSMKDAEKSLANLSQQLASKKGTFKLGEDGSKLEKANKQTKEMQGTYQKINDNLKSIVQLASALDVTHDKGQKTLVKSYNDWVGIKKTVGDTSMSFEKLYKMQQEYQRLTGKDYKIKKTSDISGLQAAIEKEKELARVKSDAEKKAKNDERTRQKRHEAEIQRLEREARKVAENKAKAAKESRELKKAEKIASPAMSMEAKTVTDYKNKINALIEAKSKLNLKTEAGRKKFAELEREIKRNRRAVEDLTQSKKGFTNVLGKFIGMVGAAAAGQALKQFTLNVITLGGELQKQKVALQSILQDVSRANIIFSQVKTQALESPFSFAQILQGTRQLSAYNIEAEKLFETQYMLSELSAGLGVEVDRLILAFGQVRAASVLRGQELRQFTEAGIPLVDALAKKFTVLEGRVVSTGEVFDKISNRLVPFQMVNDVLQEMTAEGGKFFDMQKIQSETVAGQYSNIQDALHIMFMDIADEQKGLLISLIKGTKDIIANWRTVASVLSGVSIAFAARFALSMMHYGGMITMQQKYVKLLVAEETIRKSISRLGALKWGLAGAAVAGLIALIAKLYEASQALNDFKKDINEINERGIGTAEDEANKLSVLIGQLSKVKEGSAEYSKIKDKIASQFNEFLPKIVDETTSVKDLADSYEYATGALKVYYAEKAQEESMAKLNEDEGIKKQRQKTIDSVKKVLIYNAKFTNEEAASITSSLMEQLNTALLNGKEGIDVYKELKKLASDYGKELPKNFAVSTYGNAGMLASIETPISKYSSMLKNRVDAISESNKKFYGALSNDIRENLQRVNDAYEAAIDKIDSDASKNPLSRAIALDKTKMRKEAAQIAAETLNSLNAAFIREGKKAPKGTFDIVGFIDKMMNYKENKPAFVAKFNAIGADAASDIYDGMISKMNAVQMGSSPVNFMVSKFFDDLSSGIQKNSVLSTKSSDIQAKAALEVRNMAMGFTSFTDAQALMETEEAMKKSVKQEEASLNRLKSVAGTTSEAVANAASTFEKNKAKLKTISDLIDYIGIIREDKKTKTAAGENPEIDRANRLVKIYKELLDNYQKYSKLMSNEKAKATSLLEMREQYAALNAEMGGSLPELSNIDSQAQLVEKIKSIMGGSAFKTLKGKSVLRNLLLGEEGGQIILDATETFEKIKEAAEDKLAMIDVRIDRDAAYKELEDITSELSLLGDDQKKYAIELKAKIKTQRVSDIDMDLNNLESTYGVSQDFKSIAEETGINLGKVFPDMVMSYEMYMAQLMSLRNSYAEQGAAGAKRLAELDIKIEQNVFDRTKHYIVETAKLKKQNQTEDQKLADIRLQMAEKESRLADIDWKLKQDLTEEVKAALNAEKEYIVAYVANLKIQEDATKDTVFQMSQLYLDLYGDIEQYGNFAYLKILKNMQKSVEAAKKTKNAKGEDMYEITYTRKGEDGNLIQEKDIITAKKYGTVIANIQKKIGEIERENPFRNISDDIKDAFKDGKLNAESFGNAITGIGDVIGELSPLMDSLFGTGAASEAMGATVDAISSIGAVIANPADIGAWVKLAQSFITIADTDNKINIENLTKAIEKMNKQIEGSTDALSATVGFEAYNKNIESTIKNLDRLEKAQRRIAEEQRTAKDAKIREEAEATLESAEETANRRADLLKQTIEEFSTSMESAADSFASSFVDSLLAGEDAMMSFEETFDEMMLNIVKKQVAQEFMKKALTPVIKAMQDAVDPDGESGIGITKEEMKAILIAKGVSKDLVEGYSESIQGLIDGLGLETGDFAGDTLQKGIQGITESTADVIASYMNSIRLEVVTIRTLMEKSNGGGDTSAINTAIRDLLLQYYPQYLENLIAIKENTSYLKEAYNPSIRGFRIG